MRSTTGNLNHLGIQKAPSKSTISYQNKHRNHQLFQDYYFALLNQLGQHNSFKQNKLKIKTPIYLLDSTTIPLCLSLFDWAKFRTTKGAIKLHTLLGYHSNLPHYVNITEGKIADKKSAETIPLTPGNVVVADRYYRLSFAKYLGQQQSEFCY